jgi:hypothetical protein
MLLYLTTANCDFHTDKLASLKLWYTSIKIRLFKHIFCRLTTTNSTIFYINYISMYLFIFSSCLLHSFLRLLLSNITHINRSSSSLRSSFAIYGACSLSTKNYTTILQLCVIAHTNNNTTIMTTGWNKGLIPG